MMHVLALCEQTTDPQSTVTRVTRKNRPRYYVFGGTLSLTQSINPLSPTDAGVVPRSKCNDKACYLTFIAITTPTFQ